MVSDLEIDSGRIRRKEEMEDRNYPSSRQRKLEKEYWSKWN